MEKKIDIKVPKQMNLPSWAFITLIVLAVVGIIAAGYLGYTWAHNKVYLQGAQAGYNQALIDVLSMVQNKGYATINIDKQTIYLVPAQLNSTG